MYARDPTPGEDEGEWTQWLSGHLADPDEGAPDLSSDAPAATADADNEDTVPEYPMPEDMFRYSDPEA